MIYLQLILRLFILPLLLLIAAPSLAEEFTAKVVGITDGDTIRVLRDKKEVKIRLEGID